MRLQRITAAVARRVLGTALAGALIAAALAAAPAISAAPTSPASALAAGCETSDLDEATKLGAAFTAAATGSTIHLGGDFSATTLEPVVFSYGKQLTFDLCGHDLVSEISGPLRYAAVHVTRPGSVTIVDSSGGAGSLVARGGGGAPGIGGGRGGDAGTIIIDGADVTAEGSPGGAGIGGAYEDDDSLSAHDVGIVIIRSGIVHATGGAGAPGIGGGASAVSGEVHLDGSITISGGTVIAAGGAAAPGFGGGAGIGGGGIVPGAVGSGAGTITISGGTVSATGGASASGWGGGAGIGGGNSGSGGTIRISGGTIASAQGDRGAAGIGGGSLGDGGTIDISGGTITSARGGDAGAGIGGGVIGVGGTIDISGDAVVNAFGGYGAAGIGTGARGVEGAGSTTITISGGTVTATGGDSADGVGGGAGIGGWYEFDSGQVTASGGTITATGGASGEWGSGAGIGGWIGQPLIVQAHPFPLFANGTNGGHGAGADAGWASPLDDSGDWTRSYTAQVHGEVPFETSGPGQIILTFGGAVSFDGAGGRPSPPAEALHPIGAEIPDPGVPVRAGYEFDGWFRDDETTPTTWPHTVDGDADFTAHWTWIGEETTDDWRMLADAFAGCVGTVVLSGDITAAADEYLAVPPGCAISLDLDGYELEIEAPDDHAAIEVTVTATLTIADSDGEGDGGHLRALGGAFGAGIGGKSGYSVGVIRGDSGTIIVDGGDITAIAGAVASSGDGGAGAGIGGGGWNGRAGTIVINGGVVHAQGGARGAGIGNGGSIDWDEAGGDVTINGGDVTAIGGTAAAGIGGGRGTSIDTVRINGGTVEATGGGDAAGIGGQLLGGGAAVTITGGTVSAAGGNGGTGIGAGRDQITELGTLTIEAAPFALGPNGTTGGRSTAVNGGQAPTIDDAGDWTRSYTARVTEANAGKVVITVGVAVAFAPNGGLPSPSPALALLPVGASVAEPATMARDGHDFLGWFVNGATTPTTTWPYTADENAAIAAQWAAHEFAVAFDSAGGSSVPTQTVDWDTNAIEPTDPILDGHTFAGWYLGAATTPYDFATPVTADLTLAAHWTTQSLAATATAVPGGVRIEASGTGFDPGETVEFVVHSTPYSLGTVTASPTGVVGGSWTVPASAVPPGAHTLVVTGAGGGLALSVPIVIPAALAATGLDVAPVLWTALGLLLLGGAAVGLARRRAVA